MPPSEYLKVSVAGAGSVPVADGTYSALFSTGVKRGIVGVERQRIAELLGRLCVDEVERLAVGILVLLQNPARNLRAAIGERNPVELVLDRGRRLGCCLNRGHGGGRRLEPAGLAAGAAGGSGMPAAGAAG